MTYKHHTYQVISQQCFIFLPMMFHWLLTLVSISVQAVFVSTVNKELYSQVCFLFIVIVLVYLSVWMPSFLFLFVSTTKGKKKSESRCMTYQSPLVNIPPIQKNASQLALFQLSIKTYNQYQLCVLVCSTQTRGKLQTKVVCFESCSAHVHIFKREDALLNF